MSIGKKKKEKKNDIDNYNSNFNYYNRMPLGEKRMSILIKGMKIPQGCQKCKFFTKHTFGRGIDYSYSCLLGAKKFPMPWIKQEFERAEDCPLVEIP